MYFPPHLTALLADIAPPPSSDGAAMPAWLIVLLPFLFFFVFSGFWYLVCQILSTVGGWRRLARRYGSDEPPNGTRLSGQSGKINRMGYNNCLTVHISEQGLHLAVLILFRPGHQPLLIPWRDIHDMKEDKALWMKVTRLQVGDPVIAKLQLSGEVHQLASRLVNG